MICTSWHTKSSCCGLGNTVHLWQLIKLHGKHVEPIGHFGQQTHKLRLHELQRRFTRSARTTCRLGTLCYRTTQGARPGQEWAKLSNFNLKSKRKNTANPKSVSTLNLSQDRDEGIHIRNFARSRSIYKHRCLFQCKRPSAYSSTTTLRMGSLCRSRAATYCVTCESNMSKVAERV